MGQIKFQVASPEMISTARLKHMYAVDCMLVSYSVNASITNNVLTLDLPATESCQWFFPWPMPGGDVMLCTTSLRLSEVPYEYERELARGTVGRLLAKCANWREQGIEFSETLQAKVSESRTNLIDAVFLTDAIARAEAAFLAIESAIESIQLLIEEYIGQIGSRDPALIPVTYGVVRRSSESKAALPHTDASITETVFLKSEETIRITTDDRQEAASGLNGQLDSLFLPSPQFRLDSTISQELLQVASQTQKLFKDVDFTPSQTSEIPSQKLKIGMGPILDWCSPAIEQFFPGEMDFEQLRDNLYMLSKAIVENLPKPVNSFYVAAGVGARGVKEFSDHQRLQLTLDAMCGIYKSAPDLPLLASFHQPIGHEIDNAPQAISPLHGADALIRADAGLQMIGLEISFAGDEFPSTRELLQLNELVDVWSDFGLPLFVVIKLAPKFELCQLALQMTRKTTVQVGGSSRDRPLSASAALSDRKSAKPAFDYAELRRIVSLLHTKRVVQSLFFSAPGLWADLNSAASSPGQISFEDIVKRIISESKSSKI